MSFGLRDVVCRAGNVTSTGARWPLPGPRLTAGLRGVPTVTEQKTTLSAGSGLLPDLQCVRSRPQRRQHQRLAAGAVAGPRQAREGSSLALSAVPLLSEPRARLGRR